MRIIGAPLCWFFAGFNKGFDGLARLYGGFTRRVVRLGVVVLVVYAGLIYVTYDRLMKTPTGPIPQPDREYLIVAVQLPPGSSLSRTDAVIHRAADIIVKRPGVAQSVSFAGFDGATFTNAPNAGVIFVPLQPFEKRVGKGLSSAKIVGDLYQKPGPLTDAFVLVLAPPSVPGIGTGGGAERIRPGPLRPRPARAGGRSLDHRRIGRRPHSGSHSGLHAV